jgi:hypothetical protein
MTSNTENAEARGASNHDSEGVTVSRSEGAAPRASAHQHIAHPDDCPTSIQRIASLYGVIASETNGYVSAHISDVPRSLVEQIPGLEVCVEHGNGQFSWTRLVWLYGRREPRQMMTFSTKEPPAGWVAPENRCQACGAEVDAGIMICGDCLDLVTTES